MAPSPSTTMSYRFITGSCSSLSWIVTAAASRQNHPRKGHIMSTDFVGQTRGSARAISAVPTGTALAAEITGVDLRHVDDRTFAAIHRHWLDHLVLLFRGQSLSDDELIAFSSRFGELDWAPVQETGRRFVEGHPEIYVVSNVMENGVPIGSLGAGEAIWHTDMSYIEDPPKASILY